MQRAVFLDRDGVINRAILRDGQPYPPARLEDLDVLPGVAESLARLRAAGFRLIVVTNQPDVARGKQTRAFVDAVHAELLSRGLAIDSFRVCYHDDADKCECRKPKPGLLMAAAREENVALESSYMVGDRWRDMEAGRSAGCTTVFIDQHYRETAPRTFNARVHSLPEATDWILSQLAIKEVRVNTIHNLRIKIFADGADRAGMLEMYAKPFIKGFTTNPTLMRKAGIADYRAFARDILSMITDRPISFEVLSDEFSEMERQAHEIAAWGENVYVKIPVTNTRREPSFALVQRLSHAGIKVNVTALMTLDQVRSMVESVGGGAPSYISVFAGRIADTGSDPMPLMAAALELLRPAPNAELIWASPRELLNIFQADSVGCHIITVSNDVLNKLALIGKDLTEFSLDTVKMFYQDALKAGYKL